MLSRQFNPACSLHNRTNIQSPSRLRKVDRASFNEFYSIRDMIDDICLLMVSASFVEQKFQHSRSGRRHSWIFLTSTTGRIKTVALDHDSHIVAMTGQSNISFAGVCGACDIVDRRWCCAALGGICRTRDCMNNFRNAGMAASPLLGKPGPYILDQSTILKADCNANGSAHTGGTFFHFPAGAVSDSVLEQCLPKAN